MTTLKINEQIAFLRKQKGLTQEELANALGVTNQAVSKWESAQCCPDIQLLPTIAEMFDVSVDELLGYKAASTTSDIILELRKKVDSLPKGEDFDFTFRAAAALHAILLSKDMTSVPEKNSGWDTDNAIEHAENAQWGNSCINVPEITTAMRKGTVFFSNNHVDLVSIRLVPVKILTTVFVCYTLASELGFGKTELTVNIGIGGSKQIVDRIVINSFTKHVEYLCRKLKLLNHIRKFIIFSCRPQSFGMIVDHTNNISDNFLGCRFAKLGLSE